MITRVRWAAAAATVAVLAVSGCSSSSSGGGSNPGSSTQPTAATASGVPTTVNTSAGCQATPTSGGNLVYARQTGPLGLNPFNPTNGNGDIFADTLIYQGLVMPDPKGTQSLTPAVADKYSISSNGKTYTFHLRPGIKFSNGNPVTVQDIKFSLDTWANPKLDTVAVLASGYKDTQIVNSSTVKVQLTEATPGLIDNMSIFNAMIVPEKLVQSEGNNFWNHPVGTGPFQVSNWVKGNSITFTPNKYYWQAGLPYLNSVKYLYAQNDNTRVLDLKSGQAQIADGIPYNQVNSLKTTSGIQLQAAKVPYWVGLWLNHQYGPFKDLKVRQAINYAINRDLMNQQVFAGVGTIPNSILPQLKGDASDAQLAPYTFDLSKAKQLMAESGYPHGFNATLQYFTGYTEYTDLALLLQQQLGELGIHLKLKEDDQATETKNFQDGDFQMVFPYSEFTSDVFVPDEYAQFVGVYDGIHGFWSWWKDPSIQSQIEQYVHNPNVVTRGQQWQKIQAEMVTQAPVVNLIDLPFVNGHADNVCGSYLNALGADSLQYTWLAKS